MLCPVLGSPVQEKQGLTGKSRARPQRRLRTGLSMRDEEAGRPETLYKGEKKITGGILSMCINT